VLEAVLFDWGHTLMDWTWDDALLEAGHRAGLEAVGADVHKASALTERYRAEARLFDWEAPEEVEYAPLVQAMLREIGVEIDDEQLSVFLLAEHAAWAPARRVASMSGVLLDSLRERGLKTGLVSNAWDPAWILERDLEEMGLLDRLDIVVFSSDVGFRKPRPEIFRRALDSLRVDPAHALFVGDRLQADIRGAQELGMRTVQAMWFRAEESEDGIEPDFRAFTQFDVLNVVRRLIDER
jgi:putative hydrolase of the HAD superfamily